jgi:hypothetical protein
MRVHCKSMHRDAHVPVAWLPPRVGCAFLFRFQTGSSHPRLFPVFARGAIFLSCVTKRTDDAPPVVQRRTDDAAPVVQRRTDGRAPRSNSQMASSSITGRVIASQGVIALGVAAWLIRRNQEEGKAGEGASQAPLNARKVLRAANSIVKSARSYGFVCTNWHGDSAPECRIMDTHWLNRDQALDLSLVTRTFARKTETLRKNPECSVCYHDPRASGENGCMLLVRRRNLDPTLASPSDHHRPILESRWPVTDLALSGTVREVPASSEERHRIWKDRWSFFHPSPQHEEVVVWHFVPRRAELVSHRDLISDDWAAVTLHRTRQGSSSAPPTWELQPQGRRRDEPGHPRTSQPH